MSQWHIYLVRCRDGSLYTGISTDVARRLAEHRGGKSRGARYLRGRGPLRLVYEERIGTRGRALEIEGKIKRLPKKTKERLIEIGTRILNRRCP